MKIDFVGIGSAKAGTGWIYFNLIKHPQIRISKVKEVDFFNDLYPKAYGSVKSNYKKGLNWYHDHFSFEKNKVIGELSTSYIFDPKVPKRIHKYNPDIKIIAILRDPIDRAYSEYRYVSTGMFIGNSFEEGMKQYPELVEKSLYYKQLKRYFDLFPAKNIYVILLEDVKRNPEKEYYKLCDFLNIKRIKPEIISSPNPSKEVKNKSITKFLKKAQKIKTTAIGKLLWKSKLFTTLKKKIYKKIMNWNTKPQEKNKISKQTQEQLKKYYQKDVDKLNQLLKRKTNYLK